MCLRAHICLCVRAHVCVHVRVCVCEVGGCGWLVIQDHVFSAARFLMEVTCQAEARFGGAGGGMVMVVGCRSVREIGMLVPLLLTASHCPAGVHSPASSVGIRTQGQGFPTTRCHT